MLLDLKRNTVCELVAFILGCIIATVMCNKVMGSQQLVVISKSQLLIMSSISLGFLLAVAVLLTTFIVLFIRMCAMGDDAQDFGNVLRKLNLF